MYLIDNKQTLPCNSLYYVFIYLCTNNKLFINIQANLILHQININNLHIVYLSTDKSMSRILYKLALLICVVYFIVRYKLLPLLTLEVSVFNVSSLSLYCWLGFQFLAKRSNYYFSQYKYNFTSAYNLISCKFLSKNILRRYLIFTTIMSF